MKKFLFILLLALFSTLSAQDTFSICAVDTATGEVGSAGASCIDAIQIGNAIGCALISDVHPGVGVIHSQAYYITPNQLYAQSLMNLGLSPQQIIDSLQVNDAQNNPAIRQYGVVKFNGPSSVAAAYTGSSCSSYANHIVGPNYAIQGNILLGPQILDSMEARFLNTQGDLACKLMAAMQGANVPGADTRCISSGNSSLSSFLRVANSTVLTIDLVVPNGPWGFEPIDSLQILFNNVHTCITGLNDKSPDDLFSSVFPNPATDLVQVQLLNSPTEGSVFELYDIQGMRVLVNSFQMKKQMSFDCSNLAAGIYYYHILLPEKGNSVGKIVIH
ncbi:MAG: DUF1028 domain-containing protein [Bacteroidetes bacterium]|nr:DUF1028 domain-containing protein [Bacteroidota bacterium]